LTLHVHSHKLCVPYSCLCGEETDEGLLAPMLFHYFTNSYVKYMVKALAKKKIDAWGGGQGGLN